MGSYRERLLVPVSYWLLAVPVAVMLGAEAYFFVDGFIPPAGHRRCLRDRRDLPRAAGASATIEVTGAVLRAGGDTLALSDAGEVIALDERQAARLRGPRGDPAAHLLLRPYLRRAVYVASPTQPRGRALLADRDPAPGAARGGDRERPRRATAPGTARHVNGHGQSPATGRVRGMMAHYRTGRGGYG